MFDINEELKKLPDKPGVYIMKDENKNIIYIGKAIILKNRVRQYFKSSTEHSSKVMAMVSNIKEFEYIVTDSELEALILECTLIKKHKPKYNILLKDDKNYPYIKVTMNEEFPRILLVRKLEKDGARYFGPYSSATDVRDSIELIKKLFPYKTCSRVLPRDIGKSRPCLNFDLRKCPGPCAGNISMEEYRNQMKDICSYLDGKHDEIIKRLEKQMNEASEAYEFEKAAVYRDKINSLRKTAEKQKIISADMQDRDVVSCAKDNTDACVQIFFIRSGKLIERGRFILEGAGQDDNNDIIESFLMQYYDNAAFIPGEILLHFEVSDTVVIESWLSEKRDARVHLKVPKRGEKLELVQLVYRNAELALKQFKDKLKSIGEVSSEALSKLTDLLGLSSLPIRIEAYDISNTGLSEMTASMVVFINGIPNNSEYRHFKIKSVEVQNDYACMQEVLFRRFKHAEKEKQENEQNDISTDKFTKIPDLILVDGGIGHVSSISSVMKELAINIPVYGMVKDDKHRTRGLISQQKEEFVLNNNIPVLRFITSIQDEAHRFAINYNKKLRLKRQSISALDEIDGIGPKRKKALIKHFGSVNKIKQAGIDDLMGVEGVSRAVAEKIIAHFQ